MQVERLNKTTLRLKSNDFGGDFNNLTLFPGFKKWCSKVPRTMLVRINGVNIEHLMKCWPNSEWTEEANEERLKVMDAMIAADQTKQMKESDEETFHDDSGYEYKRPPMDHQQRAFVISRDKESFAVFAEQGTGKTKITLDNAGYLYGKGEIDMLIVIVFPNGLQMNWVNYELPEDLAVPYEACYWSSKHSTKREKAKYEKVLSTDDKLKVFTFNAEAFTSDAARKMITRCLKNNRCMLVIDQSACIKNPQAKRTKFILKLREMAKYRRILDGNPSAEGALELYSQFKFLDPNIIGIDTMTVFKSQYCKIGFFNNVVGFQNLDHLYSKIDGHSFRILADDCLDLPERSYMRFPFELNSGERRIFDELKSKSIAYFDKEICEPCEGSGVEGEYSCETCGGTGKPPKSEFMEQNMALVKNMRLQQISSGWWPTEDGSVKPINEGKMSSRLSALKSLLSNIEGKCIIYARFKADLLAIQEMLGDSAVSYHGDINQEDREANKKKFKSTKKTRFIIGQIRVLGIGHTLTEAKHVIFYSNDPSLRFREEAEKRAHRKGLAHQLKIWDMVAMNTQDHKIIYSLKNKKKISNEILRDPDNFFLEE